MTKENEDPIGEMKVRRTVKEDGRYLIYFDFDRPKDDRAGEGEVPDPDRSVPDVRTSI